MYIYVYTIIIILYCTSSFVVQARAVYAAAAVIVKQSR